MFFSFIMRLFGSSNKHSGATVERRIPNIRFVKKPNNAGVETSQLVFLDLETTGLVAKRCGILEICLDDAENGPFATLVDVAQPIPARITEINGIDRDMIVGKPLFSEIAPHIYGRISSKIIVGHNVEFDLKFLFHEFLEAGIQPQPLRYICTCKAERNKNGNGGNRLVDCLRRRGIQVEKAHRAADDVNMVRRLFDCQQKERMGLKIEIFDLRKYHSILEREPEPMFESRGKAKSTHTLKTFTEWGDKSDNITVSMFNKLIEESCQDRIFEAREMKKLADLGIEKKVAMRELKKALAGLVSVYYEDRKISWDEYCDLENLSKMFGFNSATFFPLIKEVVPDLKVICFTNDLIVKDEVVDRYETLFPWSVRHGYLPSDSVTKQTDLVVNCGFKNDITGKIQKANTYGIEVMQFADFAKGKEGIH